MGVVRNPVEFHGRPFALDVPGSVQIRFALDAPLLPSRGRGPGKLQVASQPTAITVQKSSELDRRVLRLITHSRLVSLREYKEFSIGGAVDSAAESSLADFLRYVTVRWLLGHVSEDYGTDPQKMRNDSFNLRTAVEYTGKISDRNHLLREYCAILVAISYRNHTELWRTANLRPIRKALQSAEFLPTDAFNFAGRESFPRFFYEQEFASYRDERLDREYSLRPNDGETFESFVRRLADDSGVPLSLAAVPQETRDGVGRFPAAEGRTLRTWLKLQCALDWYWVRDGDGYALQYREPVFPGE